jgi:uncharacterized repeat protein (TIGR02543 family)
MFGSRGLLPGRQRSRRRWWTGLSSTAMTAAVVFGLAFGPATAAAAPTPITSLTDLSNAFLNAPSGGTITLTQDLAGTPDVPIGTGYAGGAPVALYGVTLDLAGHHVSLSETDGNAGIVFGGSLTIEDSVSGGSLTVTGGAGAPGIELDQGGTLIVNSGTVTATGGAAAAGIGGAPYAGGGTLVINGGNVTAGGGAGTLSQGPANGGGLVGGAGVGGGANGPGGTLTVNGGTLHAYGSRFAAGIGGADCAQGGSVTIGAAGSVIAESASVLAIGAGYCLSEGPDPTLETLPLGSLSNAGRLTIPQSNLMLIPAGSTVTNVGLIDNEGEIIVFGTLDTSGTIANAGTIAVRGVGGVGTITDPAHVTGHNTTVILDGNGGTAPTDPSVVYADSFSDAFIDFPPDPTWAGHTFAGWYTAPIGGSQVTDTTDLGVGGPKTLTLYAQWATVGPAAQAITFTSTAPAAASVGGSYTVGGVGGGFGNPVPFSVGAGSSGCSISGATVRFTGVGTCVLDADQAGDQDYTAAPQASQSITIGQAAQAITFTSTTPAGASVGDSYTVTTIGGASGNPVVVSVDASSSAACRINGSQVRFDHAGVCVVDADQAGNSDYAAASPTQQSISIGRAGQTVTFTATPPSAPVVGSSYSVTATGGASGDPVSLSIAAATTDGACTINGSTVTFAHPGSCVVQATQAGNNDYDAAAPATQSIAVGQSSTATTLTVTRDALVARVRAIAPDAGTPAGTVTFSVAGRTVGSQPLTDGVATLTYTTPAGATRQIAAIYSGSTDHTGSSASSSRRDPTIAATLSSPDARTKYGWYRAPVTVTFHCTTHGAPLLTSCPDPYTFRGSAAGQSVTRTIQSTDGGTATVTTVGINLDRSPPSVSIGGIRDHAVYEAAPAARCIAKDSLSGIASCKLTRRHGDGTATVTATATDKSGNTRSTHVSYTTLPIAVGDAPFTDGAFSVKAGHAYTLVMRDSMTRPIYCDAAIYPSKPVVEANAFYPDGNRRWVLGVAIDEKMRSHTYWNLGVKIGETLHVIKIRVT